MHQKFGHKRMSEDTKTAQGDRRPQIETNRLVLRPFLESDAEVQQSLVNDKTIAANTRSIEYPYPDGAALHWIKQHPQMWSDGKSAIFAVCLRDSGELTGAIGLEMSSKDESAELGYWIGRKYWNQGICSEAANAVIKFGFEVLALNKIFASHMTRNPASGRVMEKAGMLKEGLFRSHVKKWGVFEDVVFYGILRSEFEESINTVNVPPG